MKFIKKKKKKNQKKKKSHFSYSEKVGVIVYLKGLFLCGWLVESQILVNVFSWNKSPPRRVSLHQKANLVYR